MITELDDTLLYLTDVHWDSVEATHGCSSQYHVEDLHWGTVGLAQLFDSHHELWPLVCAKMCVILLGYFPSKVSIDSNLRDTLGYR
jgi:hypothetical protein